MVESTAALDFIRRTAYKMTKLTTTAPITPDTEPIIIIVLVPPFCLSLFPCTDIVVANVDSEDIGVESEKVAFDVDDTDDSDLGVLDPKPLPLTGLNVCPVEDKLFCVDVLCIVELFWVI